MRDGNARLLLATLLLAAVGAACPAGTGSRFHPPPGGKGGDAAAQADAADPGPDEVAGLPADPGTNVDPGGAVDPGDARDPGADESTSTGGAAATWCRSWANAACAFHKRCPHLAVDGFGVPAATCSDTLSAQCGGSTLGTVAAQGWVSFDAGAASRCLAALAQRDCATAETSLATRTDGPFPECGAVVTGLRMAGGDCSVDSECAAGSRCVIGTSCPGTCVAWATGACSPSDPCNPSSAVCSGGSCTALPSLENSPCPDGVCAAPRVCDASTLACRTASGTGQLCGVGSPPCVGGLTCVQAGPAAVGQCAAPARKGGSCFVDGDCDADAAGWPMVCMGGGCAVAPGSGQTCVSLQCSQAWCDTSAVIPTCRDLPAAGDGCVLGQLCGPGLVCVAGACVVPSEGGQACTLPQACASGSCVAGLCTEPGAGPCP